MTPSTRWLRSNLAFRDSASSFPSGADNTTSTSRSDAARSTPWARSAKNWFMRSGTNRPMAKAERRFKRRAASLGVYRSSRTAASTRALLSAATGPLLFTT